MSRDSWWGGGQGVLGAKINNLVKLPGMNARIFFRKIVYNFSFCNSFFPNFNIHHEIFKIFFSLMTSPRTFSNLLLDPNRLLAHRFDPEPLAAHSFAFIHCLSSTCLSPEFYGQCFSDGQEHPPTLRRKAAGGGEQCSVFTYLFLPKLLA